MNAIDLSKQEALAAILMLDPRAIQQIKFTIKSGRNGNTRIFFILEEAKEPVLDILQETVKVL